MITEEAIEILRRMSNDGYYGSHVHEALRMGIEALEKQKEHFRDDTKMMQKPLSTEETELNSLAFLEQIGYTCIPPGKEQKPAELSEEDKEELKYTVSVLERCGFSDSANWLKDLPNRFNLQPKQEWSEEDGLRLESCMAYLCNIRDVIEFSKQIGDNAKKSGKQEIQKNIDWLKFLPERISRPIKSDNWKPSDEQMEALSWAINYLTDIEQGCASTLSLLKFNLKELL